MEHTIELLTGYTDAKGVTHRTVTFGRRLSVGDLLRLDGDPQSRNPTQYSDLVRRQMITKFGELKMPVALNVLLDLDSVDREDLEAAAGEFLRISRQENDIEYREDHTIVMNFGFDKDGTVYDVCRFGRLTTGRDEVDADTQGLAGLSREAFLIGRQITAIQTRDGAAVLDGAVDLATFKSLDAEDFNLLRIGAQLWRHSFRMQRTEVSGKRDGSAGVADDDGNGNDRTANSGYADRAHQDLSQGSEGTANDLTKRPDIKKKQSGDGGGNAGGDNTSFDAKQSDDGNDNAEIDDQQVKTALAAEVAAP